MGACTFTDFGPNNIDRPLQAFEMALKAAQYEYGHGGYTGSLAEKREIVIIEAKPITKDAAWKMANALLDEDDPRISDKWGPAGAIRVKDADFNGWFFFGWASE